MRSARPKVLHELGGRPMLEWVARAAREAGADDVVAVVSPGIEDQVLERMPGIRLAVQDPPLGTGHAAQVGLAVVPDDVESVIVLNGDVPAIRADTIRAVVEARTTGAAAALISARTPPPHDYGRIVRGPHGVERIVEARDATSDELEIDEFNVGVYCFDAGALRRALARLTPHNAQGELLLTDVVALLAADGERSVAVEVDDPASCEGVNTLVELAEREAQLNRRTCERLMLAGARIVDPATTYVDDTVTLAPDCRIEPFTTLRGATSVGAGSVLGPHVVVDGAVVGERCVIGPFAYLRPGTVLHERAQVGRFVEVKKSTIGERSKVPHLSYIGDAEIGSDSNIGAGNITANYDGSAKHVTRIGSRVHTSCDTIFVAPVRVGDDAYTGAGSTITDDVPDGALGIARAHQTNIEGYAERVRRRREPS